MIKPVLLLLIAVTLLQPCFSEETSTKKFTINGELKCDGKPMKNAKVMLVSIANNSNFKKQKIETELDTVKTNSSGLFTVKGEIDVLYEVEPKIYVYHKCRYPWKCQRKDPYDVPDDFFIALEKNSTYTMDPIELAQATHQVKIVC
ncbi:unnamed protein product [Nippostrongylus brasiliensis]|uniref:Transthyretin-like family protein n=1 Tax=Nippostrongylus brasiliensis TaxID=27835 RepID=A0A0N4YA52_NIPBR|nr:hypothetical protein Q1695_004739 [Nippostrongylus brasiliensis]VDL76831.1 unnamed protein product [Nippostrongylus brasiliensis]